MHPKKGILMLVTFKYKTMWIQNRKHLIQYKLYTYNRDQVSVVIHSPTAGFLIPFLFLSGLLFDIFIFVFFQFLWDPIFHLLPFLSVAIIVVFIFLFLLLPLSNIKIKGLHLMKSFHKCYLFCSLQWSLCRF